MQRMKLKFVAVCCGRVTRFIVNESRIIAIFIIDIGDCDPHPFGLVILARRIYAQSGDDPSPGIPLACQPYFLMFLRITRSKRLRALSVSLRVVIGMFKLTSSL